MNTATLSIIGSRKRLLQSLGVSLALHAAALSWFYLHPILVRGPFESLFGMSVPHPTPLESGEETDSLQKNRLLEEVFQQIIVLSPHFQQPYDLAQLPKGIALSPHLEEEVAHTQSTDGDVAFSLPLNGFILAEDTALPEREEADAPPFFISSSVETSIASQLQIDAPFAPLDLPSIDLASSDEATCADLISASEPALFADLETSAPLDALSSGEDLQIATSQRPISPPITAKNLHIRNEQVRSPLLVPSETAFATGNREISIASPLDDPESYDFPAIARAKEWNDDFDIDVTFLPHPKGQGYIFSLALKSNYDLGSHSLRQNLYYVLDRSSSVQKHRFAVFKRAVLKSLAGMQRSDTFNIIVLDKKIVRFSSENLLPSQKNIQAAEAFLDKQDSGILFDSSDIYAMLDKILPSIPDNEEVHTAILLTDGKTGMNTERKQAVLKKWVEKNNGKIAIYPCAIGQGNDLFSLDMLASVSGGKLLYSDTHASFPRKLSKLVLDLKDPIAKDLIITALPHNPNARIAFHTAGSHRVPLYSQQPYLVYGEIDDPCSFDLILQGRHGAEWIAIKKQVSFIDGHKGDHAMENRWNAQHANICYSRFLEEGKKALLNQAKEILKKSRSEVAFE